MHNVISDTLLFLVTSIQHIEELTIVIQTRTR